MNTKSVIVHKYNSDGFDRECRKTLRAWLRESYDNNPEYFTVCELQGEGLVALIIGDNEDGKDVWCVLSHTTDDNGDRIVSESFDIVVENSLCMGTYLEEKLKELILSRNSDK